MADAPRRVRGRPAPLLARLGVGGLEETAEPVLGIEALAASVERNLRHLLATRAVAGPAAGATILGFGVPDRTHLSPASVDARTAMAAGIAAAVGRFERRLERVEVTVEPHPRAAGMALCRIAGELRHGSVMQRVRFELALDAGTEAVLER